MRLRYWVLGGLLALLPLTGCAKLNEWLEGSAAEEEETSDITPEEQIELQKAALAGDVADDRKKAIGILLGLKREDALTVVLLHVNDADPKVAGEVLGQLQGLTGFPEKTEDERQLDPEGYDQQVAFKQQVVNEGLMGLRRVLTREEIGLRHDALIVVYNLAQAPVVPADAKTQLVDKCAAGVAAVAADQAAPVDTRLLAVDALVAIGAGEQVAGLAPLLADPSETLRGRVALAMGQVADSPGLDKGAVVGALHDLAADPAQPEAVRWRAMAALGRLGTDQARGLDQPFSLEINPDEADDLEPSEKLSPLETYRGYALAGSTEPSAAGAVQSLNQELHSIATQAEEELKAERKKGYR